MRPIAYVCVAIIFGCIFSGCASKTMYRGDYPIKEEADWIRNAEPILFEDEAWYPTDDVENFLDREMMPMGQYRDVPFYIEKRDVRPFDRLYTKFANHKYRAFLRMTK